MSDTITRTPLSPIDYTFIGDSAYPIEFVFRFDGRLDPEKLKTSLARVLPDFAPVGSILKKTGAMTYAFETSNDACPFTVVETEKDPSIDLPEAYDILDPVNTIPGEPLARIEVTLGRTQSVIGVSLSHSIVDGYSYFYFLAAWAAACRGESYRAPVHDRALLMPANLPEMDLSEEAIRAGSGWSLGEARKAPKRESLRWERIHFSKDELMEDVRASSEKTGLRISINDVLVIRLWKRFGVSWPAEDERRFLSLPIDFRRVHPEIDLRYFGNAVRGVVLEMSVSELESISISDAAARVNKAVRGIKADQALLSLSQLEALRRTQGADALKRLHVVHPSAGLLVTNLSRVPIQRLDFGLGAPLDYRILTPAPRAAAVLPTPEGLAVDVCAPV